MFTTKAVLICFLCAFPNGSRAASDGWEFTGCGGSRGDELHSSLRSETPRDIFGRRYSHTSGLATYYAANPFDPLPQFKPCDRVAAQKVRHPIENDERMWDLEMTRLPKNVIP